MNEKIKKTDKNDTEKRYNHEGFRPTDETKRILEAAVRVGVNKTALINRLVEGYAAQEIKRIMDDFTKGLTLPRWLSRVRIPSLAPFSPNEGGKIPEGIQVSHLDEYEHA